MIKNTIRLEEHRYVHKRVMKLGIAIVSISVSRLLDHSKFFCVFCGLLGADPWNALIVTANYLWYKFSFVLPTIGSSLKLPAIYNY